MRVAADGSKASAATAEAAAVKAGNDNWAGLSEEKRQAFGSAFLAGRNCRNTGDAHYSAGADRTTLGWAMLQLGNQKYGASDYSAAAAAYDCPCTTQGAFQHYSAAYNDWSCANYCYTQAIQNFNIAIGITRP